MPPMKGCRTNQLHLLYRYSLNMEGKSFVCKWLDNRHQSCHPHTLICSPASLPLHFLHLWRAFKIQGAQCHVQGPVKPQRAHRVLPQSREDNAGSRLKQRRLPAGAEGHECFRTSLMGSCSCQSLHGLLTCLHSSSNNRYIAPGWR